MAHPRLRLVGELAERLGERRIKEHRIVAEALTPPRRLRDHALSHALHDLQFTARTALGGTGAPSAVLLGADGQLAGGPVNGGSAVIEFVQEIREQLAEAQEHAARLEAAAVERARTEIEELEALHEHAIEARSTADALRRITGQ